MTHYFLSHHLLSRLNPKEHLLAHIIRKLELPDLRYSWI
jgi:hypothetical protein